MQLHHPYSAANVSSGPSGACLAAPVWQLCVLRPPWPLQRVSEVRACRLFTKASAAETPAAERYTLRNAASQRGSEFWRKGPASAEFFRTRTPSKPGHAGLVEELARHHYIDARPAEALRQVDRQLFVPQGTPEEHVYLDVPLRFARGQTVSAPHMHAYALQTLYKSIRHGAAVLDVGSGSGYLVAACAVLAGSTGTVLGVETAPKLVQISLHNLKCWQHAHAGQPMASITIRCGNAWQGDVLEGFGPFDAIHVGAAADSVPEVSLTASMLYSFTPVQEAVVELCA